MRPSILLGTSLAAILLAAGPAIAQGYMSGYAGGIPPGVEGGMHADDYATALRLIHRAQYSDAIPFLERAHAGRPHSADILNNLGFVHRMLGDYDLSLSYFQKALAEDPDHKSAHEYLGELYLNMHDLPLAQTQLAELVRLCPTNCDERDTLTKSIASYQSAAPATAAPAPAQTTAPAQPQGPH